MKIILCFVLAFLCICGHSVAESALMIRNVFGAFYLYEYNLESSQWKSYDIAFEDPFLIQGRMDDRPLIADYVSESDRIDLYAYEGDGNSSLIASAGIENRADIDYVFAYHAGWIYAVSEEDMILQIKDGTVRELAHTVIGGWMVSDIFVEFPAMSPSGRIAFWNEVDEAVGLSILDVGDDAVATDFIPVYRHSPGTSVNGYFAPLPPMIWLDDAKVLGFLIRKDMQSDLYFTDAVCIDVNGHGYSQYLDVNGMPVCFRDEIGGHPSLMPDGKCILLTAGNPLDRYWGNFDYYPAEKWLAQLSLETGELVHLTEIPDDQTTMGAYSMISVNL